MHPIELMGRNTGGIHEAFTLGRVKVDTPAYNDRMHKLWDGKRWAKIGDGDRARDIEYLSYDDARAVLKDSSVQWGTPTKPEKFPADWIRRKLMEELAEAGLFKTIKEGNERVRYYSASGSHFDKLHGVDAFIEYEDPETKKTYIVTFDTTLNREKINGERPAKANVVIGSLPEARDEENRESPSDEFIEIIAPIVAQAREVILAQRRHFLR